MSANTSPEPVGPSVVVLEDRPLVAVGLESMLRAAGFTVTSESAADVVVAGRTSGTVAGPAVAVADHATVDDLVAAIRAATTPSARDEVVPAKAELTPRERTVLAAVGEGKSARDIAHSLGISARTVERHKQNVTAKLGVANHARALAVAVAEGHIPAAS